MSWFLKKLIGDREDLVAREMLDRVNKAALSVAANLCHVLAHDSGIARNRDHPSPEGVAIGALMELVDVAIEYGAITREAIDIGRRNMRGRLGNEMDAAIKRAVMQD